MGSRISSIARTKYKHLSYQLFFVQKGGATLIPCYPSAGAKTDIQRVAARGDRRSGGAFEGGGVPGGAHPFSPPRGGCYLIPCYLFLDGVQDIAALAASVVAQGGIRHVSDRAPLRASAALRPGAEVNREH